MTSKKNELKNLTSHFELLHKINKVLDKHGPHVTCDAYLLDDLVTVGIEHKTDVNKLAAIRQDLLKEGIKLRLVTFAKSSSRTLPTTCLVENLKISTTTQRFLALKQYQPDQRVIEAQKLLDHMAHMAGHSSKVKIQIVN